MESTREPVSRYRLYVAASNVIDLIAGAGGWVADHAMAGWDVTGAVADSHDDRNGQSLHILGAGVTEFQTVRDLGEPNAPHTLAIAPICTNEMRGFAPAWRAPRVVSFGVSSIKRLISR